MSYANTNTMPVSYGTDLELTLGQLITLLSQEHDDQTVTKLVREFCLQSTSNEFNKKGMEFLYINGYYDDLKMLIEKNRKSENESNRKWAKVYQLILDCRFGRNSHYQSIQQLENMETAESELQCLLELTKVILYYDLGVFDKVGNFLEMKQHLFAKIDDSFLLSSFNLRVYQLLFIYYWMRNELIIARKYAFRALNETKNPEIKVNIHKNLGLSYTFDTYEQGMYHLWEALKLAKKHHLPEQARTIEQRNIPFLSAHFKRVDGIQTEDANEQAHIEIAKGNYNKAISILSASPVNSPFKMYYLGLAKQDKNILLQAYNYFLEKRNDYFFSRLPLNELKKMDRFR